MVVLTGEMILEFLETLENHIRELRTSIDMESVGKLIESIVSSRSIFIMGAGRSGFVAKSFAMRLMHLGYNVYVVGETTTPKIKKDDLLITISGSGETSSVVNITMKAKSMVGSKIAVITSSPNSSLAKMSDVVVVIKGKVKTEKDDRISKLAPLGTMFELTSMIFLDALVAELLNIKGLTEDNLKEKHAILE
ncbi:3-hexulose-6-phosphate isomerase [Archaeoglobus sulfaticallidus PM70-1]|uniref:3-hexulose-6-phosphate isomerase n=1 Tax=Archaeoglobus sulfaticallidus PM70-1 TaxID=387631 RepID=N0BJ55_9EURY|nr:6-phospho-3-hexuloisomerase [Archaeoglobus sulfaticallidus]AGK60200.1 3-hexulose-6-phosphate isomerase [Archaeoglobus sulfaticallidus PM70-1]